MVALCRRALCTTPISFACYDDDDNHCFKQKTLVCSRSLAKEGTKTLHRYAKLKRLNYVYLTRLPLKNDWELNRLVVVCGRVCVCVC